MERFAKVLSFISINRVPEILCRLFVIFSLSASAVFSEVYLIVLSAPLYNLRTNALFAEQDNREKNIVEEPKLSITAD